MEINSNKNQLTPQSDEEKKILKELVSKGILKATTKSERAFTIDGDLETIFKENNYDCLECAEKVMRKITGKVPEEVDGAVSHTVIGRFPIGSTDQKNIESVISSLNQHIKYTEVKDSLLFINTCILYHIGLISRTTYTNN